MRTARRRGGFGLLLIELALLAAVLIGGAAAVRYGLDRYYHSAYPLGYRELIDAACAEKGLSRSLVYAVVHTESGFQPEATSHLGAKGLMQLMPDAFDWVQMRKGLSEPPAQGLYDPATNIEYGTSMLRLLQDEFGSVENTLAAYHAGWGSVKRWLDDPELSPDGKTLTRIPFADTADYVKKVQRTMGIYQKLYALPSSTEIEANEGEDRR